LANSFVRQPVIGGDSGSYGPYAQQQFDAALGYMTSKLINNAGTLQVTAGRIGINDGVNLGLAVIPAATNISIAANSNSLWILITMTVAGTAVTFTAADVAGATDPTLLPSSVKSAYDGTKGGFYVSASARAIGLCWKVGGVLLAVVNFKGAQWYASDIGGNLQNGPGEGFVIKTTGLNMDTTAVFSIAHNLGAFSVAIAHIRSAVTQGGGTTNLDMINDAADPSLAMGGVYGWNGVNFALTRRTGGYFDSAGWNNATVYSKIYMLDF